MTESELKKLVENLTSAEQESEWVEFKENRARPEEIGEYLSAIANSAALHGRKAGYIVWGVADETGEIVGTSFRPHSDDAKIGNEEVEAWLSRQLSPRVDFRIHEVDFDGKIVVIFEVFAAAHTPIRFRDTKFVRVGSYKKKLKDFPEKERALWAQVGTTSFGRGVAAANVSSDLVLDHLDYPAYFDLAGQRLPDNRSGILDRLQSEKLIIANDDQSFDITNLGGILFAKNLQKFDGLTRKAVRVIVYKGKGRVEPLRELVGQKGYAAGFAGLIDFVNGQLPQNEHIGQAFRAETPMYPEIAVRELVANALIHQDFSIAGTGSMIEIFDGRVEITNPGVPLIDSQRFLDAPPESRNEALAALMRRLNICEERGSGIDKVFTAIEMFQLPAAEFRVTERHTKSILYAYKSFANMHKNDRIRACYQHAALMEVTDQATTNASVRERFSIAEKNYSMASRVIRETMDAGLIKPFDPGSRSKKHARYLPFWA